MESGLGSTPTDETFFMVKTATLPLSYQHTQQRSAGPSGSTGTSLNICSSPIQPLLHNDILPTDAALDSHMMVDDLPGTSLNIPSSPVPPPVYENEEENEEEKDVEPVSDFYVDGDEGLEGGNEGLEGSGGDDDDDELIAGQGQQGISLWDTLGEGFLKEASQLGVSFKYYSLNIFQLLF